MTIQSITTIMTGITTIMTGKDEAKLFPGSGMKPMMILPPDGLSAEDIQKLNDNGICTVVAKNPNVLRFLDPIPVVAQRTQMEQAAIRMSRRLLNWNFRNNSGMIVESLSKSYILNLWVSLLIEGTSMDQNGSKEEQLQRAYDEEHEEELRRLARADAKAAHQQKKALSVAKKTDAQK